jgi:type IV pilus assembly protein PilQ
MRAFKTVGIQVAIGGLLCAAIAAGTTSCAGSGSSAPPSASATAPSEVVDVLVDSSEGGTTITVVGPVEPVMNTHPETNPDRVVVDLANVKPGDIEKAIPVHDGRVEEIRVAPLGNQETQATTRVEVVLATPSAHQVTAGPEGVVIKLAPAGQTADAQDPWAAQTGDEAAQADDGSTGAWAGEPAEGELHESHPATVLSGVDAHSVGNGAIVHLQGDGVVDSAQTFTLEGPPRLVIDLPAMKSQVAKKTIEVGAPQVARVRVGTHDDKVRIVVDGGTAKAPFEGRRVVPVPSGLIVALGSDPALDAEVANASGMPPTQGALAASSKASKKPATAPAKAAEAGGPVKITGVQFDPQTERDRVVVLSEQPVDYLVYEPDPETLILSIASATIAPEAAVRIAPQKVAAVSLVTAFAQPDVKRPEVRVVVKRAAGLKPVLERHDNVLTMDFANNGKVAAVPPVYAEHPAARASGEAPAAPGKAPAAAMPAEPASGAPPASIEILSEGGLMDGKEYVGRHISLDFKDVDIADVLRLIAEVSDLNVIAGDEVKGKVTIRLVDEPWDQALDVILLTKGLGFVRVGNVLRIAAKDVLAQEEELRLQERRAKEKLEDLVVKLQPVNYAKVADVEKMVKKLLSERGSINIDKRTNTLIIKDIPSVIDEATALVKAVDAMTPQVMIEARIVEAGLQYSRDLGTKWAFGANPLTESTLGGRDYVFTQGPGGDLTPGSLVSFGNSAAADNANGLFGLAASVLDQKFNFDVELQAAELNGEGKVISSPRVVTLDNSPAVIEQGVSIPFQTFENGDAQLEFVDAVLKLDVTPHITADGSIIMKIKVSRNAPDDSVATTDGTPGIAKNQVKTETLVRDGQTLVLGGIYVVDRSDTGTATPFLSRLPFLGALFRSQSVSDERKELLIFVSPRVVETTPTAS